MFQGWPTQHPWAPQGHQSWPVLPCSSTLSATCMPKACGENPIPIWTGTVEPLGVYRFYSKKGPHTRNVWDQIPAGLLLLASLPDPSTFGSPPESTGRARISQAAWVPEALAAANGGSHWSLDGLENLWETMDFPMNYIGGADKFPLNHPIVMIKSVDIFTNFNIGVCTVNYGAQKPAVSVTGQHLKVIEILRKTKTPWCKDGGFPEGTPTHPKKRNLCWPPSQANIQGASWGMSKINATNLQDSERKVHYNVNCRIKTYAFGTFWGSPTEDFRNPPYVQITVKERFEMGMLRLPSIWFLIVHQGSRFFWAPCRSCLPGPVV